MIVVPVLPVVAHVVAIILPVVANVVAAILPVLATVAPLAADTIAAKSILQILSAFAGGQLARPPSAYAVAAQSGQRGRPIHAVRDAGTGNAGRDARTVRRQC
jgi:hypothetical protein